MNICILGAGTYGSYAVDSIQRKFPDAHITVFDVGGQKVKSESEIGYFSKLKRSMYKGLTDGRYFGWGGASHKWGGQLLTFTDNDFAHPDLFMKDIIKLDDKYKDIFLSRFNLENKAGENWVSDRLFTKTGIWLSMLHRNLFKWFKVDRRKNVTVLSYCRIVKLLTADNKTIDGVVYLEDGIEKQASFDYYFLTAGAFESVRILMSSGMLPDSVHFSDHLSQKMFKVKKTTKIGAEDFVFRMKGTSLLTKRVIGEINDISFYVHPVFNLEFPFFKLIKEILYQRKFSVKNIGRYFVTILKDIPHIFGFVWSVLIRRRMYVMNNEWFLYIDIENPTKDSFIALSKELDSYGIPGLDVYYNLGPETESTFRAAQEIAVQYLDSNNVEYEVVSKNIDLEKCEDIYHPYAMFDFKSAADYFSRWNNMLIVSTGILPRSGGINPTAAAFPLIDEFVEGHLSYIKT